MDFIAFLYEFLYENIGFVLLILGVILVVGLFAILFFGKKAMKSAEFSEKESSVKVKNIKAENNDVEQVCECICDEEKCYLVDSNAKGTGIEHAKKEELKQDKSPESVKADLSDSEDLKVLAGFESVVKESDAIIDAMQEIIEQNQKQVEAISNDKDLMTDLEVSCDDKECKIISKSIVSKYKVLYDKTKKEWVVKKEGSTRAIKRCALKEDAIEYAKKCTIDSQNGNTFHKEDGKFKKRTN